MTVPEHVPIDSMLPPALAFSIGETATRNARLVAGRTGEGRFLRHRRRDGAWACACETHAEPALTETHPKGPAPIGRKVRVLVSDRGARR